MNYRYLLLLSFAWQLGAQEMGVPHEVQELAAQLQNKKEVTSVNIDGFYAGLHHLPSCSFCHQVKDEDFKQDTMVRNWYTAFGNCRCAEHHELIRSLEWIAAPSLGAVAGFMAGESIANTYQLTKKLVAIPCALLVALQAARLNKKIYGWLSDMLDRRADAAALKVCPTKTEKEHVIAYLEEKTKDVVAPDVTADSDQEYQLFCVNAYDGAQSNLCSFITIHIQFPVPWLPSGDEIKKKIKNRVAYLTQFLDKSAD